MKGIIILILVSIIFTALFFSILYALTETSWGDWIVRGGRVCLDNLQRFLSDKLFCLMPLPASEVVYSSKHHPVSFGQDFDADAVGCRTQNTL
jgi:hypothetical protein